MMDWRTFETLWALEPMSFYYAALTELESRHDIYGRTILEACMLTFDLDGVKSDVFRILYHTVITIPGS